MQHNANKTVSISIRPVNTLYREATFLSGCTVTCDCALCRIGDVQFVAQLAMQGTSISDVGHVIKPLYVHCIAS